MFGLHIMQKDEMILYHDSMTRDLIIKEYNIPKRIRGKE